MKTDELNYHLPPDLIAQQPPAVRTDSRLLVLNRRDGGLTNTCFSQIRDFLSTGDCLVLNDTKVLPARFYAQRKTGAALEGLFLDTSGPSVWKVMLKGLRKIRIGEHIFIKSTDGDDFCPAEVLEKLDEGRCLLRIDSSQSTADTLERIGFAPLPPYIRRRKGQNRSDTDILRYQTVYARNPGAIAAPTAGLHFTEDLIASLERSGICIARITLHVGAGTFKPVKADILEDHQMEPERFTIDTENAQKIDSCRRGRGRVIAVGTTAVRTLESAASKGPIRPASGQTNLFITPGYRFGIVDAMITNFHLPKSTLLALVAAFAGLDNILTAYRRAVENRYRFYSYGDAMLIL